MSVYIIPAADVEKLASFIVTVAHTPNYAHLLHSMSAAPILTTVTDLQATAEELHRVNILAYNTRYPGENISPEPTQYQHAAATRPQLWGILSSWLYQCDEAPPTPMYAYMLSFYHDINREIARQTMEREQAQINPGVSLWA